MPTFSIDGPGFDGTPFEADDWMDATAQALTSIASKTHIENLECEIGPDGDIVVVGADFRFVIRERGHTLRRRLPSLPDPLAAPTPISAALLDAPEPDALPAWQEREAHGEEILAELDDHCAPIDAATSTGAPEVALDVLMKVVPAESGAVLLLDGPSLRFAAARGPRARLVAGMIIPKDAGIAGLVARRQVALTVKEAGKDPAHYTGIDRKVHYDTRAILCVPLRKDGRGVGVLQLLNPFGEAEFASWHLGAAQLVAGRLAARLSAGA